MLYFCENAGSVAGGGMVWIILCTGRGITFSLAYPCTTCRSTSQYSGRGTERSIGYFIFVLPAGDTQQKTERKRQLAHGRGGVGRRAKSYYHTTARKPDPLYFIQYSLDYRVYFFNRSTYFLSPPHSPPLPLPSSSAHSTNLIILVASGTTTWMTSIFA
jgi:hypothetical protein